MRDATDELVREFDEADAEYRAAMESGYEWMEDAALEKAGMSGLSLMRHLYLRGAVMSPLAIEAGGRCWFLRIVAQGYSITLMQDEAELVTQDYPGDTYDRWMNRSAN